MSTGIVTGASSGMGRTCVDHLRALVDVVVAVDLVSPRIDDTIGFGCDVSDPAAVTELRDRVAEIGPFRALVHAAGISPTMGLPRRILEVDLVGTELVLRAFEDLAVPGSAAVCLSSSAAYSFAPRLDAELEDLLSDPLADDFLDRAVTLVSGSGLAYGLAKVGVIRSAARASTRWALRGGRVNSVAPGIIDTPMGRRELERQPAMAEMLSRTPAGRMGRPDEVAAVAAFLVSDASSYVCGIDVLVDGGLQQAP